MTEKKKMYEVVVDAKGRINLEGRVVDGEPINPPVILSDVSILLTGYDKNNKIDMKYRNTFLKMVRKNMPKYANAFCQGERQLGRACDGKTIKEVPIQYYSIRDYLP